MSRLSRQLLFFLIAIGFAAPAAAENISGLQFTISNGVESRVSSDLKATYDKAFSGSSWKLVDTQKTRAKLSPVVRDCFTDDCLVKAGKATKTKAGIRVQVSGEAQIYDWTVETFDLRTGKKLASRKGACELCGQSEVARTFGTTVKDVLKNTTLTARPKAAVAVVPTKKPDPTPEPEETKPETKFDTITLVKIKIDVEPPDASITFRDAEIGRGRAEIEVGPGNHEFQFEADGHRIVKELVVIDPSSSDSVALRVHLPKKDAPPEAVTVASNGAVDKMGDTRLIWALAAGGTGVVLVGVGMYLTAIDGEAACDDGAFKECPEVYKTGGAGFITTFTGAILLTGGAVLLAWDLLAGESSAPQEAGVHVAPALVDGNAGLSVFGRF